MNNNARRQTKLTPMAFRIARPLSGRGRNYRAVSVKSMRKGNDSRYWVKTSRASRWPAAWTSFSVSPATRSLVGSSVTR